MTPLLFPTQNLEEDEVITITDIYNKANPLYSAEFNLDFTFDTHNFECFKGYSNIEAGPTMLLGKNRHPFYISFMKVGYSIDRGRYGYSTASSYEMHTWGILPLKRDCGHILIKRETWIDKIHELLQPVELDFEEDKPFSDKFYVIASDDQKARDNLTAAFRNHIMDIPLKEFIIEIVGDKLIIGNDKIIDPQTAMVMAEFLNKMDRV